LAHPTPLRREGKTLHSRSAITVVNLSTFSREREGSGCSAARGSTFPRQHRTPHDELLTAAGFSARRTDRARLAQRLGTFDAAAAIGKKVDDTVPATCCLCVPCRPLPRDERVRKRVHRFIDETRRDVAQAPKMVPRADMS
jgi:hypothetical protein